MLKCSKWWSSVSIHFLIRVNTNFVNRTKASNEISAYTAWISFQSVSRLRGLRMCPIRRNPAALGLESIQETRLAPCVVSTALENFYPGMFVRPYDSATGHHLVGNKTVGYNARSQGIRNQQALLVSFHCRMNIGTIVGRLLKLFCCHLLKK